MLADERKGLRVALDGYQRQIEKIAESMTREQRLTLLDTIKRALERTLESIPRNIL